MRYILIFLLLYALPSQAQIISEKDKIIASYDSIRKVAPREKIYVHFDKKDYLSQDTIWFKAYLVNATLLSYSQVSGLIYTDIINTNGEVVQTLSLPTNMGLTWGAFALNENQYPPGKYTFRAYTNWMQNFGNANIYKKEITILAEELPKTEIVTSVTSAKKLQTSNNNSISAREIDIQFLPESGTWLAGINQKIAFKTIDKSGKGIEVSGEIFDSNQNLITSFKSNKLGMGTFLMFSNANEVYRAKINTESNSFTRSLPKSKQIGTSIKLENDLDQDSLSITVFSSLQNQPLTIIGQARGVLCFIASANADRQKTTIKVAKNIFPTGVAQIILMNNQKEVLNERNFFLNLNNQLRIKTSSKSLTYAIRDSIPLQITVADLDNKPVASSLSIAVTDDSQVNKDATNDENILTYFLLIADLKGEIEKPGYYFSIINQQTTTDLDALMLTQGWVSYDWDLNAKPIYKAEKEYNVSGRVTNIANKPVVNAKITMLGKNKSTIVMDALTNENGEFFFNQFPLIDSANFIIQALNSKGKSGTLGIEVNTFKRPAIPIAQPTNNNFEAQLDSTAIEQINTKKQVYQAALKSGIMLREVKITGKKIIKSSKNLNGAGMASQIITEENLAPIYKKTLFDVLQEKVKGFRVGNRRKVPTIDFFVNFDYARFVFDGIEIDYFYHPPEGFMDVNDYYNYVKFYLDYYNAEDIKGIEVLANGYSFRYKSRFQHPLDQATYTYFEITTKTGAGPFLKKSANMFLLKPVNYGSDKVFYSPKYASKTTSNTLPDYRSTIYWSPNVVTKLNGEATTSFYAGDKKGTYTVWIEGTDADGSFGFSTLKLTIK